MKSLLPALRKQLPHVACDLAGCIGLAAIAYGGFLIFEPAGFIVGGLELVGLAMFKGKSLNATPE